MSPRPVWTHWLVALCLFSGCATMQDTHYEYTQRFRSETALLKFCWCNKSAYPLDYGSGWKAGYYDVITGGCGKPPTYAPHPYWHPFQILHHCDEKRIRWYQGFQDGAAVAMTQPDTHYLRPWNVPNYCPVPAVTPTPQLYYEVGPVSHENNVIPEEPPPVQGNGEKESAPLPEVTIEPTDSSK